jgi:predicted lipoprotein with Yx(FWY)xxD motif
MRPKLAWGSIVLVAVSGLAACGDDGGGTGTTAGQSSGAAVATTTAAGAVGGYDYGGGAAAATTTEPSAAASATVTLARTGAGQVLADTKGRTLYVFLKDEKDKSNCTGSCLQTWPRYAPSGVQAGPGIDAWRLGTITVDGVQQLTIDGRPLYYFASDAAPGDVKGQGVAGNWYVVDGTGSIVK